MVQQSVSDARLPYRRPKHPHESRVESVGNPIRNEVPLEGRRGDSGPRIEYSGWLDLVTEARQQSLSLRHDMSRPVVLGIGSGPESYSPLRQPPPVEQLPRIFLARWSDVG